MTGFHESSVWWLLLLLAVPFLAATRLILNLIDGQVARET